MNVAAKLLEIVEKAYSLTRILEAGADVIAAHLEVDACFVFLLDDRGELVQSAAHEAGPPGNRRWGAAALSIAAEVTEQRCASTTRAEGGTLLACPMLLRDGVLGALAVLRTASSDFSEEEIAKLDGISGQLVGIVQNARIIAALETGEAPPSQSWRRSGPGPSADGERILRGVGVSPGVAIGIAVFRGGYRLDRSARERPAAEPAQERARVQIALDKARNDILRVQTATARELDEEHALIFAAQLLILNDSTLLRRIDEEIAAGRSAPLAIDVTFTEIEARLRQVPDAYIQEKVHDIDDVRSRVLDHVLESRTRPRFGASIVLSSRIPPSLVIELKTEGARALVTEVGGTLSHGVLLARALGIPTVTGIADIQLVQPDDTLIVDGSDGAVIARPSAETLARYEREQRRIERARTEHAKFRRLPCRTADGVRVTLHANVAVGSDISLARDNGADGIGLFRTEFPFVVRDAFPTVREQVRIYAKAHELFPDKPIHFRILDLGGDKFVASSSVTGARSAFHGYRSMRVLFDHPEVLRDQVQALALAAGARPLRILIPMVTSIEELRRSRSMISEALAGLDEESAQKAPEIGAMIEVPAAVELAADIAKEVDFLSVGTNDLMQYTLVVDREDSRMAQLSDPYHPAILRMVSRVVNAAHLEGKSVSVCGEIAARPDIAVALVALGVDSLSVVPAGIPELKQALAGARLDRMRREIGDILSLSDAGSIAAALREAMGP